MEAGSAVLADLFELRTLVCVQKVTEFFEYTASAKAIGGRFFGTRFLNFGFRMFKSKFFFVFSKKGSQEPFKIFSNPCKS